MVLYLRINMLKTVGFEPRTSVILGRYSTADPQRPNTGDLIIGQNNQSILSFVSICGDKDTQIDRQIGFGEIICFTV